MRFQQHRSFIILSSLLLTVGAGCGGAGQQAPSATTPGAASQGGEATATSEVAQAEATAGKEEPPPSGPVREVEFPPITRQTTKNGVELNVVPMEALPVVQVSLVIKSGSASDPEKMPGMARLVAAMLKEGTAKRSSAELAQAVEFLGAKLSVHHDEENVYVEIHALKEHFEEALDIVSEMVMRPRFSGAELTKLKKRELDRLALRANDPHFLASRAFFQRLYGDHPYAHIDTTPGVVKRMKRNDLVRWHRTHFAPNNAFLVVVGQVTPEQVETAANEAFKGWKARQVPEPGYTKPPSRDQRQIVLVDRPGSVQSVIYLGNLAIPRNHEDYVPLLVANQVLGGSAASRLFMDLREKRSLTYGAYSRLYENVKVAPFRAYASVRNEVTGEAMQAFMHHLDRITGEPPPDAELRDAKRYLADSFPLRIDTTRKIASLVQEQRIHALPDDYWNSFRQDIRNVSSGAALEAAQRHIRPDQMVVVVVGKAADIAKTLAQYGELTVVDVEGKVLPAPEPATPAPQAQEEAGDAAPPQTSEQAGGSAAAGT